MQPEDMDKAWTEFLAHRRGPAAPDPDFTRQVMESVRALEASRASSKWVGKARLGLGTGTSAARALGRFMLDWLRPRPLSRQWMAPASVLLLAGAAALYLGEHRGAAGGADITRIKGGEFNLGFLLKRGNRIEAAVPGGRYLPGDRLQAVYSAADSGYIHLFSIDETGAVSCFSCQGENPALPAGQMKTLAFALELDGSTRAEALVGFWARRPLPSQDLEKNLKAAWERAGHGFSGLESFLAAGMPEGGRVSVFKLMKGRKI